MIEYIRMNRSATFHLFKKQHSFLSGLSSILYSPQSYHYSKNDADVDAISADWKAIGSDMKKALNLYAAESRKSAR